MVYTPVNQFYCIKVGFKGFKLYRLVFVILFAKAQADLNLRWARMTEYALAHLAADSSFKYFKTVSLILYKLHYGEVRGDFSRPPHGTEHKL